MAWDGEILVPFAAESSLSGVGRRVGAEQELWYERSFTIPLKWSGRRVLLHFGAVDWRADVWVNGVSPGPPRGRLYAVRLRCHSGAAKRRQHAPRAGLGPHGRRLPTARQAGE